MKLKIKNFCKRIEVEILITKWTTMRFYMTNAIFKGRREKKEKKELHRRQSYSPPSPHVAPLERRRCEDSNDTVERWLWPLEDIALTTRRPRAPPNTCQPLFQFNNILYLFKNQIASTNLIIIKKLS